METEVAGLRQRRSKQAVELAMQGRWREAAAVNQSLVESFPSDVSAYNRLGRAYMEIGDFSHAWEAYSRAVELDPYNYHCPEKSRSAVSFKGGQYRRPGRFSR